jgi:hypothetical protein
MSKPNRAHRLTQALAAALISLSALAAVAPQAAAADRPWFAPPPAPDRTVRTRTLPWTGGEHLGVAIAADVRYVPGASNTVSITGPNDLIHDIVVDNGVIRHDQEQWRWWRWSFRRTSDIRIVVTTPRISDASVSGSGRLDLGRLSQERLDARVSGSGALAAAGAIRTVSTTVSGSGSARITDLNANDLDAHLSGSGWIRAAGTTNTLRLSISGSGSADLGSLTVQDAEARLSGSGSARVAPRRSADLEVSGSGSIRLLTEPPRVNVRKSGSGSVIRASNG